MKSLNDKITVSFNVPASTVDEVKTYTVKDSLNNVIFQGTVFVPKSSTSQRIEIGLNDILRSEVDKTTILDEYNPDEYHPVKSYTVQLSGITKVENVKDIFLGYWNIVNSYSTRCLITESQAATAPGNKQLAPMLQGVSSYSLSNVPSQRMTLYPRYPFVSTNKFNFAQMFSVGDQHEDIAISLTSGDDSVWTSGFVHNNYVDNLCMPLEDLYDVIPYKKEITMSSDVFTETKITGEKLWLVTVNGRYLYEDESIRDFIKSLGYSTNFFDNFFAVNPDDRDDDTYYMAYYTNNPEEIDEKWAQYIINPTRASMSYERKDKLSNWVLELYPKDKQWNIAQYHRFVGHFSSNYGISEAYINKVWGITKDTISNMPDLIRIKMPDFISNGGQWEPFIEDFFGGFNVYAQLFDPYDPSDVIHLGGDDIYETYVEETIPVQIKIADIDECPAKYYLQWIDRYKGVQCQPFSGKNAYEINYGVTNILSRYNEKSPTAYNNTYQFEINTGWLTDDVYPLYESIFVSPQLKLYDTENDICHNVIVVDKNFKEKTRKNQGKLYNFTLKLEINTDETILY